MDVSIKVVLLLLFAVYCCLLVTIDGNNDEKKKNQDQTRRRRAREESIMHVYIHDVYKGIRFLFFSNAAVTFAPSCFVVVAAFFFRIFEFFV